jgi:hypothetical protein
MDKAVRTHIRLDFPVEFHTNSRSYPAPGTFCHSGSVPVLELETMAQRSACGAVESKSDSPRTVYWPRRWGVRIGRAWEILILLHLLSGT